MKRGKIKLKIYAGKVGVMNNVPAERKFLQIFVWSFGLLALLYVLILGNMVFNIVERRSLEAEARTLVSEVGDLELRFLTLSGKIDPEFGYSLGFVENKVEHF